MTARQAIPPRRMLQFAVACVLALSSIARAGTISLEPVGTFAEPIFITASPADPSRTYVVERAGRIQILVNGKRRPTPFLDVTSLVTTRVEAGLLSMALPPDYATSGLVYIYYIDNAGQHSIRIREYRRSASDPNRVDPTSGREVLKIAHAENENHYGGQLQFGPDGYLYAGTGDGGSAGDPPNNAQNPDALLGKILRFDPRGATPGAHTNPPDNPFAGGGGAPEIYAYGLRNPWRFSFDRATGSLAIGDVGQDEIEEVDFLGSGAARGVNFGWRNYEGTRPFGGYPAIPSAVPPIFEYDHSGGNCSITGGYVVRDRSLPSLVGRYVYADFCVGELRSLIPFGSTRDDRPVGPTAAQPVSFGEDTACRVYIAYGNTVARLTESGVAPGAGCTADVVVPPSVLPPSPVAPPPGGRTLIGLVTLGDTRVDTLLNVGIEQACSANRVGKCRVFAWLPKPQARRLGIRSGAIGQRVYAGGAVTDVAGAGRTTLRLRLGKAAAAALRRNRDALPITLQLDVSVEVPGTVPRMVRRSVTITR